MTIGLPSLRPAAKFTKGKPSTEPLMSVPGLRHVECDMNGIEISMQNNKFGLGVVVSGLGAHGASEKGLLVGDVIIGVNDVMVKDHASAMSIVKNTPSGGMVKFSVAGETRKIVLDKTYGGPGVTVANRVGEAGVLVTYLKPEGVAAKMGVKVGDIILSVNGCLVIQHHHAISLIDASEKTIDLVVASTMHAYKTSAYVDPKDPTRIYIPRTDASSYDSTVSSASSASYNSYNENDCS